jgi:L-alanine-DL-glutamate epimerase-like enolase superfamily enzyme
MMNALSGLDIALWDIHGKLEGVPASTLLGGAKRQQIECYASLMQYYGNPEHLKRNIGRALDQGYRWIKLHERTPKAVAIAREVTGPEVRSWSIRIALGQRPMLKLKSLPWLR